MSLKQRLGFTQEPIYVMDGNAFLFRGYFANSRMTRTDGFPTGALFIVGRVLLKLLREEKPSHFVFIMDGHGKNFRHEIFPPTRPTALPPPKSWSCRSSPCRRWCAPSA